MVEARQQRLQIVSPDCATVVRGGAMRLAQVLRSLLSKAVPTENPA